MARKKTKSNGEKVKTSKMKKVEEVSSDLPKKDSNAAPEGVKFRVTFLVAQSFRGVYYKQGESVELSEKDAKAYSKRSTLKIEPLENL